MSFVAVASIMVDYILTACISAVSAVLNATSFFQLPHHVILILVLALWTTRLEQPSAATSFTITRDTAEKIKEIEPAGVNHLIAAITDASLVKAFTGIDIASGPPGTLVVIDGSNFGEEVRSVRFGGFSAGNDGASPSSGGRNRPPGAFHDRVRAGSPSGPFRQAGVAPMGSRRALLTTIDPHASSPARSRGGLWGQWA